MFKKATVFQCIVFLISLVAFSGISTAPLWAADKLRVSALKFGTVNWVLDTIVMRKLHEKYNFELEVLPLASTNGANIALQGGSANIVVTDWTWVSRRRAAGADFTMVPYSSAVGHVMVAGDAQIKTLMDLKGKKIGVAGGPLDKSWLFLRAFAEQKYGVELQDIVTPVYGAAPLLTQKAIRGEFDAVLNFWHYSARLKAKGFRSIVSIGDVMIELGTSQPTVAIGFAFSEKWADKNEKTLKGFLSAVRDAIAVLDQEETIWSEIRPRMNVEDDKTFIALKSAFREGVLRRPLVVEQADVGRLYRVLAQIGGQELVGPSSALSPGTFWLTGDVSQPVPMGEMQ